MNSETKAVIAAAVIRLRNDREGADAQIKNLREDLNHLEKRRDEYTHAIVQLQGDLDAAG